MKWVNVCIVKIKDWDEEIKLKKVVVNDKKPTQDELIHICHEMKENYMSKICLMNRFDTITIEYEIL